MMTTHRQRLNTNDTSTTSTTHPTQQLLRCNNAHACGTKNTGQSPHRFEQQSVPGHESSRFERQGVPGQKPSPL